ncbi:hypothetical protein BWI17_21125 [Betaproteobacteria bacterium GR16-43]|nr:hypothetical protein BWI17_21125 [Betaproteobacteria bacterium GR16-43]
MAFATDLLVIVLIVVLFLSPWAFFAQTVTGVKIPFWQVVVVGVVIGSALLHVLGTQTAYYLGVYGGLPFVTGIVAAFMAHHTRKK